MTALSVFDVQHFCFQDGPGIRTVVFAKGCSLRCAWCHNPESLRMRPELLYYAEKCAHCGLCARACRTGAHTLDASGHSFRRGACAACGACAAGCPARALELAGGRRDAPSLLEEILRDKDVYDQTGGGVTLSGGEPLAQPEAAGELLAACRRQGVHTALETAGNVPDEHLWPALSETDLLLWDMKAVSPTAHRLGTGVDNAAILANLEAVFSRYRGEIWIRVPVIPGFNDNENEMRAMAGFLGGRRVARVELLPYHETAASKYAALEMEYALAGALPPGAETMNRLRRAIAGDWKVV